MHPNLDSALESILALQVYAITAYRKVIFEDKKLLS